ncbi:MAG TPA: c-type cytochrome [Anaerolineales bacterium]|nr:c-type cytochrome [Anaerolineales bacterium]
MKRILLGIAAALALGACSLAGDITPPPDLATAQAQGTGLPATAAPLVPPAVRPDVAAGSLIFAEKCAPCHGASGDGQGPQAASLPNPPAALADLAVARAAVPSDWYRTVTEGRIESFMPGFSSLDDGQRWDVVGYALSLGLPASQVEGGRELFLQTCAACHGEQGQGQGTAPDLTSPENLAQHSLQQVYDTITGGGTGMPGYAESLSDDQRWMLAAYVRSLGLAPPPQPTTVATETPAGPTTTAEAGAITAPAQTATSVTSAGLGRISGSVVNGTAGATVPSGLEITLHGFDGDQEALTLTQAAAPDGAFSFSGIEPVDGRGYVATTNYQDVLYGSDVAQWPSGSTELQLPLTIYETTSETGDVQISRLHLLFDFPAGDVVRVVELWLLSNRGDRTVYSGADGAIQVDLPPQASGLSFDGGTAGDRFQVTDGGFRDRREVIPGENTSELIFSYNLPYNGRLDLVRRPDYPVAATVAMVTGEGPEIVDGGFTDMGLRQISGATLHTYQRGPSSAGEEIALTMRGRPSSGPSGAASVPSIIAGAAALLLALVAAGLIWYRPRRRAARLPPAAASGSERDRALWAIASLDNEFAAGAMDASTYREKRAELVRRAQAASRD